MVIPTMIAICDQSELGHTNPLNRRIRDGRIKEGT